MEYCACGQQYFLMSNLHFENNLDSRSFVLQREYILAKPARDAAAKAKMEAEGASVTEVPVHEDNEWNIRYKVPQFYLFFNGYIIETHFSSSFSEILTHRHCVLAFLFLFQCCR